MIRKLGIGAVGITLLAGGVWFLTRSSGDAASVVRTAPPTSNVTDAAPSQGALRFAIAGDNRATFLIDAPLEKIKGKSTHLRGEIEVLPSDLQKTHGQLDLDLGELKTETFGDKDKDAAQTEHAHNWFELGEGAKDREQNRWARFSFTSLLSSTPSSLAEVTETNGVREVKVVAAGNLWLHGVSSSKTVHLSVKFTGPAAAPTSINLTTDEAFFVSLKEHDVKPRDVAGSFLQGALEKVGKKIDDQVQISLFLRADVVNANSKP
jgi:hypothetical protein